MIKLASELNRPYSPVYERLKVLKRNGGISCIRSFSIVEDYTIIDCIIPKLKSEKLSNIKVSNYDGFVKKHFKTRSTTSVIRRWSRTLQPILLQHFAGTLNLGIERMLANYIAENFTDYSDIDWQ